MNNVYDLHIRNGEKVLMECSGSFLNILSRKLCKHSEIYTNVVCGVCGVCVYSDDGGDGSGGGGEGGGGGDGSGGGSGGGGGGERGDIG